MSSSPVRVALVGLGAWGVRAHLPSLHRHPGVVIAAVVDPDANRVAEVAARYAVPIALTDASALWSHAGAFDAVVIATPTDTHHDLVMPAIALGRHVLCEKPLALDLAQARAMTDAAATAGIVTRLGFMFRHSPAIARMKDLLAEGYVGTVVAFQSHTMNAQFIDPATPVHWKMRRAVANGGVFAEYGAHAIDLALWLVGPIEQVVAQAATVVDRRPDAAGAMVAVDVDDAASWLARFAGGAQGSFQTSWSTLPVGGGGVRVYGTRGSLAWQPDITLRSSEVLLGATVDRPEPETLTRFEASPSSPDDASSPSIGISADYNDRLVASFIADIRDGTQTGPDFADGLRAQAVLAAIPSSLGTGRWERVRPVTGPAPGMR